MPDVEPFHTAELGGVQYRVANDKLRSVFSGSLVGWEVRSAKLLHEDEPVIEKERTEVARMTPYTESTGPRDAGDGFRWVEYRRTVGRGIIIVPPVGWKPEDDVMRATTGEITAIATEDFGEVKKFPSSFVLVEPVAGWKNVGAGSVAAGEPSTKTLVITGVIIVAAVGFGYWAWGDK